MRESVGPVYVRIGNNMAALSFYLPKRSDVHKHNLIAQQRAGLSVSGRGI